MTQPDFTAARRFAIYQLKNHLAPAITYHSPVHTLEEVLPAVDRMILAEGVANADDQLLLRTAACSTTWATPAPTTSMKWSAPKSLPANCLDLVIPPNRWKPSRQ